MKQVLSETGIFTIFEGCCSMMLFPRNNYWNYLKNVISTSIFSPLLRVGFDRIFGASTPGFHFMTRRCKHLLCMCNVYRKCVDPGDLFISWCFRQKSVCECPLHRFCFGVNLQYIELTCRFFSCRTGFPWCATIRRRSLKTFMWDFFISLNFIKDCEKI